MEPENRPYVDPDTQPGDAGTEEWTDRTPGADDPDAAGPLADPIGKTTAEDVIEGSPADEFISDPNAIERSPDEG
jgi:hypothetical protein